MLENREGDHGIMESLTITGSVNDLTPQDIDILLESIDSWLKRRAAGEIFGNLMGAMLIKDGDRSEFDRRMSEKQAQEQFQINEERDNAAMLKAKLIMIKRAALKDR